MSTVDMPRTKGNADAKNPWLGLSAYTEDVHALFFGRERETAEIFRLVRRESLTVLFGQSGLGKTSLLNAGLFPLLRAEEFLPIYIRLDFSASSPDFVAQIKATLAENVRRHQVDAPLPGAEESLWEYFHRHETDFWSARNRLLTPVLVFDQFEEIFTLGRSSEERANRIQQLLAELAELIENRPSDTVSARIEADPEVGRAFAYDKRNYKVILSLREDYLPHLEGMKEQIRAVMFNRYRLTPMSGLQALDVVVEPGRGLIEAEAAIQVVQFVAGGEGRGVFGEVAEERLAELEVEPALLSVVCRELNTKRLQRGEERITADLLSGTTSEILKDFYERSVADVPSQVHVFIEERLLTRSGYRDMVALEDALEVEGVTQEVIDTLVNRRLLRLEAHFGMPRVELTHDVLTSVIQESRDHRREVELQAEESRQEAELRRKLRRSRMVIGLFAVLMVVLVAALVVAYRARNEAQTARDKEVAALARTQTALEQETAARDQARLALEEARVARDKAVAAEARVLEIVESLRQESLYNRHSELMNTNSMSLACDRMIQLTHGKEQANWHGTKAFFLSLLGDNEGAIREATLAIEMNPENPWHLSLRTYFYMKGGYSEECIADAEKVAQFLPNDFISKLNKHMSLGHLGRFEEAKTVCAAAFECLESDPDMIIYQHQVSPDIASATYRRKLVVDTYEMRAAMHYSLVGLRLYAGDIRFASALAAADSQPSSMNAYLYAINWAWLQMELRPQDYGSLVQQALLWNRAGFHDYELSCYERFLQAHKDYRDQRYANLAEWVDEQISKPVASETVTPAAISSTKRSEDPDVLLQVLEVEELRAIGRWDEAHERISRVIELEPTNLLHRLRRANIRLQLQDYDGAIADADTVLGVEAGNTPALVLRAWSRVNLNGITDPKALEDWRSILSRNPYQFDALYRYSLAIMDEKPGEALEMLKRCQNLDSTIEEINELVENLKERIASE